MLLCIDVGNTQMVFGLYADLDESLQTRSASMGLIHHFRLPTRTDGTADEMALSVLELLSLRGVNVSDDISGVVVSSTNPGVGAAVVEMVNDWFSVPVVVVGHEIETGLKIEYLEPKEVGADRIADAVAARDLYGAPCIVVDFGTATTFDVVSRSGSYLGGAIVPGVAISLDALFGRAAALRRVRMDAPVSVIGRSTEESLRSGTMFGYGSMVDGMCEKIEAEVGPATVIGTGGLCPMIAPFSQKIVSEEPWLTLHGLRLLFERNSS